MREQNNRWWNREDVTEDDLFGNIFAVVGRLDDEQEETRRVRNTHHMAIYENRNIQGTRPGEYKHVESGDSSLVLNGSQACVDTLASKIAVVKPKPQFLTVDGSFEEQQRAKGLQRFIMGNFQAGGVYQKNKDVFLDAGICDIGAIKVYDNDGEIGYERVFSDEIVVDEQAAISSEPVEVFQRKFVARDILAAAYPDSESDIRHSAAPSLSAADMVTVDLVEVIEAWHLPSGPESGDGRHSIVVNNATLLDEEWDEKWLPFSFLRWTKRRRGFDGQGLIEQLQPIQEELNELLVKSQETMGLLGVPWVIVPEGCELVGDHLTNEIGAVIKTRGPGKPEVMIHPSIHPEVMARIEFLFNKMFEISGLSQLSATSRKPAGVESGVALRTLLDTETQRFALLVDGWQEFHLELARLTVKMARRMAKDNPDFGVVFHDKELARKIKWSEVDLEEDKYRLELWPVNLLPDTPAGKLAYVEQMITIGLIDPEQGRSLLDYPDIEAFQKLANAATDDAKMLIDHMLMEGDYIPPEPFQNLGMCINLMQSAWLRGRINGYPQDKLDLLSRWMREANGRLDGARMEEQAQSQMAQAGPLPSSPPAGPPPMLPPPGGPQGMPDALPEMAA
jgi:hypothetical protein